MWKRSDFDFKEMVGEGASTKVYRAVERQSGKQVAVKVLSKKVIVDLNAEHVLRREIEIQHHLKLGY